MRAGLLSVSMISTAPLAVACSGEKPNWTDEQGWVAARCEAAAKVLVDGGEAGVQEAFEMWRGVTDPFTGGTTDGSMELRQSARNSIGAIFDGGAKARHFFDDNCGADALANVRRVL